MTPDGLSFLHETSDALLGVWQTQVFHHDGCSIPTRRTKGYGTRNYITVGSYVRFANLLQGPVEDGVFDLTIEKVLAKGQHRLALGENVIDDFFRFSIWIIQECGPSLSNTD